MKSITMSPTSMKQKSRQEWLEEAATVADFPFGCSHTKIE